MSLTPPSLIPTWGEKSLHESESFCESAWGQQPLAAKGRLQSTGFNGNWGPDSALVISAIVLMLAHCNWSPPCRPLPRHVPVWKPWGAPVSVLQSSVWPAGVPKPHSHQPRGREPRELALKESRPQAPAVCDVQALLKRIVFTPSSVFIDRGRGRDDKWSDNTLPSIILQ